jgi:2-C-methyl-D-erythritol 4-phosphate cytidylyltransferase
MRTVAIVPAGGKGKRLGKNIPKQYIKFFGKELIAYTLDVFQKSPLIDEIVIAAEPEYFKKLHSIKEKYKLKKITNIISGGEERQNSVFNALSSLACKKNDLVLVHDAARPLLTAKILNEAVLTAQKKGNAVVCIKARDTLIQSNDAVSYVNRDSIYYVQTPQIFKFADLMFSFEKADENNFKATDESMLAVNAGFKINIVEGSLLNFKVTTADDIAIFKQLIKR